MELAILALMVMGACALVVYSLWPSRGADADQIRRRAMGQRGDAPEAANLHNLAKTNARNSLLEKAAPMLSKAMGQRSEQEQTTLRVKLFNAGYRDENTPTVFLASKTIAGVILGLVGFFMAASVGKPMTTLLGQTMLAAGIGFMLPEVWLWMARSQRMDGIRNGLPDALDLMVVSVEAGLGLDAAVQRVGDEMRHVHPDLSEELQLATMETQMGITRGDALEKMAVRTGVEEMRSLVAVITQAEKLGTSIAKALRVQAETLRTKRRQKAEERAQKTAVKLMLPLILFIFPAILVVLGAPAGIKVYETMSKGALSGK